MKNAVMKIFMGVLAMLSVISCRKIKAHKYKGEYQCEINYKYFDAAPSYIDSTYSNSLFIDIEKKDIRVMATVEPNIDVLIPIDSLKKNEEYKYQLNHYFYQIKFIEDSVYFSIGDGTLGYSFSHTFQGKKI